jgi:hypothetical protein
MGTGNLSSLAVTSVYLKRTAVLANTVLELLYTVERTVWLYLYNLYTALTLLHPGAAYSVVVAVQHLHDDEGCIETPHSLATRVYTQTHRFFDGHSIRVWKVRVFPRRQINPALRWSTPRLTKKTAEQALWFWPLPYSGGEGSDHNLGVPDCPKVHIVLFRVAFGNAVVVTDADLASTLASVDAAEYRMAVCPNRQSAFGVRTALMFGYLCGDEPPSELALSDDYRTVLTQHERYPMVHEIQLPDEVEDPLGDLVQLDWPSYSPSPSPCDEGHSPYTSSIPSPIASYHRSIPLCCYDTGVSPTTKGKEGSFCSICRSAYTDPVLMTCLHCFCRRCIEKWLMPGLTRCCPVCRQACSIQGPVYL